MIRISTVIIAQDEAQHLERCVRPCLGFSDEILVVDGGSADDTPAVAERLGCRVIQNPWPGYAAQRNLGAEHAANDWIFSVDADEIVDDGLVEALSALRRTGPPNGAVAYTVERVNSFLGDWFTESPERKVRLYDRRRLGFTDAPVHEVVDIPVEATDVLPGHLWHVNYGDLEQATSGLNFYTSLEADVAAAERPMKPWRLVVRPLARFAQRFVVERSFRHGWRGLFFSLHWAYWELLREMKIYERRRKR